LIGILAALPPGLTELACHQDSDDELQSTYRSERVQDSQDHRVLDLGFPEICGVSQPIRPFGFCFCETNPFFSEIICGGGSGDLYVHSHRGRGAASSAAGGLEALELV
jgi:hypothetical protein